jgi:hypothetical protein
LVFGCLLPISVRSFIRRPLDSDGHAAGHLTALGTKCESVRARTILHERNLRFHSFYPAELASESSENENPAEWRALLNSGLAGILAGLLSGLLRLLPRVLAGLLSLLTRLAVLTTALLQLAFVVLIHFRSPKVAEI